MKRAVAPENSRQAQRRLRWKEILLGALLLWIGATNLGPVRGVYDAHRGTLRGIFLLVCECALLVGSVGAIAVGARPLWIWRTAPAEGEQDWGGLAAKRLCKLAIMSFIGLAWCLGSLR